MPHDISLTPVSRARRIPQFVIALGGVALLVALLVSGPAPEPDPRDSDAAAPTYEDWHGNVRRSR